MSGRLTGAGAGGGGASRDSPKILPDGMGGDGAGTYMRFGDGERAYTGFGGG